MKLKYYFKMKKKLNVCHDDQKSSNIAEMIKKGYFRKYTYSRVSKNFRCIFAAAVLFVKT